MCVLQDMSLGLSQKPEVQTGQKRYKIDNKNSCQSKHVHVWSSAGSGADRTTSPGYNQQATLTWSCPDKKHFNYKMYINQHHFLMTISMCKILQCNCSTPIEYILFTCRTGGTQHPFNVIQCAKTWKTIAHVKNGGVHIALDTAAVPPIAAAPRPLICQVWEFWHNQFFCGLHSPNCTIYPETGT